MEVALDYVDDCLRLARHMEISELVLSIEKKLKETLSWGNG